MRHFKMNLERTRSFFLRAAVPLVLNLCTGIVLGQAVSGTPQLSERVLFFETRATHALPSQGYRIEIFDNGEVIFTGFQNVARLGEHRLNISRRALISLLPRLWNIQTSRQPVIDTNIPEQPACPADSTCDQTHALFKANWKVEIRAFDGRKTYERRLVDPAYEAVLVQVLERSIPLRNLRCPFHLPQDIPLVPFGLIPKGTELCERKANSEKHILDVENAN